MKTIFSFILLVLVGCLDVIEPQSAEQNNIWVELDPRLDLDENGYYHLQIDTTSWQTLHRLSGTAYNNDVPFEALKVYWGSSHYWYIGDTLGYVVNMGLTDDLEYVSYDTSYITWFTGFEVPTINCCSYSNGDGEVNTMFAPVRTMISDSVTISMYYYNDVGNPITTFFDIVLD
jgi:hypothetical protein|tara:strand:+ start:889 stop:1410 length:522 start_codon:yes stop_codon:yes gene_type:complete